MNLSLSGYDRKSASFCFDGLVSPDFTVEMSGNMKVKTCSDGGIFCGVCEKVNSELAGIMLSGYAVVKYSGDTAPTVGYCKLCGDGKGGVKADSKNGFDYLVTDIDTNKKTIGIIL